VEPNKLFHCNLSKFRHGQVLSLLFSSVLGKKICSLWWTNEKVIDLVFLMMPKKVVGKHDAFFCDAYALGEQ